MAAHSLRGAPTIGVDQPNMAGGLRRRGMTMPDDMAGATVGTTSEEGSQGLRSTAAPELSGGFGATSRTDAVYASLVAARGA